MRQRTRCALERALRLEQDTLSYYQAMKDVLGEDEILEAERNHVAVLLDRVESGA